jgi:nucleoside-diphosphate-sugar epimerase
MGRFAITGAGGFIGGVLAQLCAERGHEVLALARRPAPYGRWMPWALGQPLPAACVGVDAIFHLASATLVARGSLDEAVDLDLSGARVLLDAVRSAQPAPRFIFLSSQSARAEAGNRYGRSKFAIEAMLDRPNEIVVRPGLVYDDKRSSVFGMFESLSRLPVAPAVSTTPNIQPIHVRELAECLLRIAGIDRPERLYCVGAPEPMTLAEAIRATARRSNRRPPLLLPLPLAPIRLAASVADRLLGVSPPITERIDGLTALQPMTTLPSLQALDVRLEPL